MWGQSCWDFQTGVGCLRGNKCKWKHPGEWVENPGETPEQLPEEAAPPEEEAADEGRQAHMTRGQNEHSRSKRKQVLEQLFAGKGTVVYCGYVDDPRNTDNAWMETTACVVWPRPLNLD